MWNCFLFLKNVFFRYNMIMMLTRDTSLLQFDFIFFNQKQRGYSTVLWQVEGSNMPKMWNKPAELPKQGRWSVIFKM